MDLGGRRSLAAKLTKLKSQGRVGEGDSSRCGGRHHRLLRTLRAYPVSKTLRITPQLLSGAKKGPSARLGPKFARRKCRREETGTDSVVDTQSADTH
jgi:hypothetical protein